jgi:hypothetical protein
MRIRRSSGLAAAFIILFIISAVAAQQQKASCDEGIRYTIVADTSPVQIFVNREKDTRRVFVLLRDEDFNEGCLRTLLKLLSERYSEHPWLSVRVFTSLEAIPTPEDFDNMRLYGPLPNYREFKNAYLARDPRGMTITYEIPGKVPSRHLFVGPTEVQTKATAPQRETDWPALLKEIKIFKTNRSELEKMLGILAESEIDRAWGIEADYWLNETSVSALYSKGPCSSESEDGYNVDKGLLVDFRVNFDEPLDISLFTYDLARFDKYELEDVIGLFTYTNERAGIRMSGSLTQFSAVGIFPDEEQEKLACENLVRRK